MRMHMLMHRVLLYIYTSCYLDSNFLFHRVSCILHTLVNLFNCSNVLLHKVSVNGLVSARVQQYLIARWQHNGWAERTNNMVRKHILDMSIYSIGYMLRKRAIHYFTRQIEHTLSYMCSAKHLFLGRFHIGIYPHITNAKILCEYIVLRLSQGLTIGQVFSGLYKWQMY